MNETVEELTEMLEERYERYEFVLENGSNDPFWADGINLNLIRNHIIYYKSRLKEMILSDELPEVYHRKTPDKVDQDYMAHADKIRSNAVAALNKLNSYEHLDELKDAYLYLNQKELCDSGILIAVNRVNGLSQAIKDDDLVEMRCLSRDPDQELKNLNMTYENLCQIKAEEKQISLFEMKM